MKTIDIKKQYKTRNGEKVTLLSDQGHDIYPITGLIGRNTQPDTWSKTGSYMNDKIGDLDLIEVTPEKPERNFDKELIDFAYDITSRLRTKHNHYNISASICAYAINLHNEIISNLGNPEDYD